MIAEERRSLLVARASRPRDGEPGWYPVSDGRGRIRFRNRHRKQGCLLLQGSPERLSPCDRAYHVTGGRAIHVIVLSNHIPVFQRAPHNAREWQSPSPAAPGPIPRHRGRPPIARAGRSLPSRAPSSDRPDRASLGDGDVSRRTSRRPTLRAVAVAVAATRVQGPCPGPRNVDVTPPQDSPKRESPGHATRRASSSGREPGQPRGSRRFEASPWTACCRQ